MTEETDHAAEAVRLVDEAMVSGSPELAVVYTSAAQVHATLAVAEQLRAVNLFSSLQLTANLVSSGHVDPSDFVARGQRVSERIEKIVGRD